MSGEPNFNEKQRLEFLNNRLTEISKNFSTISPKDILELKDVFLDMGIYSRRLGGGAYRNKMIKRITENTERWFTDLNSDKLMRILNTNLIENEIKEKKFSGDTVTSLESLITGRQQSLNSLVSQGNSVGMLTSLFGNTSKELNERKTTINNLRDWIEKDRKELQRLKGLEFRTKKLSHLIDIARKFKSEIASIDSEIKSIKSTVHQRNKASVLEAKLSKAAAVDDKLRQDIHRVKSKIQPTVLCPYCSGPLGTNKHLDHIYPVSKGGLNIQENLVYCCYTCNSVKSNKGLRDFCRIRNLDFMEVVNRLEKLGKHI